jgi:hypothetical protein
MRRLIIVAMIIAAVVVSAGIAMAAPPTTTTTTTTTTTVPPQPTRGVIQCVAAGISDWTPWLSMHEHTTVRYNGTSGDVDYPNIEIDTSTDGTNDSGIVFGAQVNAVTSGTWTHAWPYVRLRCRNTINTGGAPVIVWMLS